MRKKILISLGIFFALIIILVVGLLFISQTQQFREFVKRTAEDIVSSTTGQQFTIGALEGNFFNNITMTDVSFVVEGENFVSVNEVVVDYALLHMLNSSTLFSRVIPVDDLIITGLDVNLIKYSDGTWNFEKIGDPEAVEKDSDKKQSGPPEWSIVLSKFLLENALISTDDREQNKVSKYEIPNVDLSVKLFDIYREIDLNLRNAEFNAPDQNLSISGVSTKAVYSEDRISIDDFKLLYNEAEITLNASAENLQDRPKFSFDASAHNFVIENIGTINVETEGSGEYVSSTDIRASATIKIPESEILQKKVSGTLETINMTGTTISISGGNFDSGLGVIKLGGDIDLKRIISKEGNNNFDINLSLDDIKTTEIFTLIDAATEGPSDFPIDTTLGATLNSEINATGSWEEFSDLIANADIKEFKIVGEQAGDLEIEGTVNYSSSSLGTNIKMNLNEVNFGSILANDNLYSKITSDLSVKSKVPLQGDFFQELSADIDGAISPSSIFGINLSDGTIDVLYENQILDIKSLELNSDKNKIIASGTSPGPLEADFAYDIELQNLGFLSGISSDLTLAGSLKASGNVTGSLLNPKITIDSEVLDFGMDEKYTAKSIKIDGSGTVTTQDPELDFNLDISTATLGNKEIQEIILKASSEGTAINADLKVIENDQFNYEVVGSLLDLSSTQRDIEISQLLLKLEDTTLDNRDNILLTIASGNFVLNNFNLYHNNSSILANANISSGNKIDGSVKISNISLDDVTKALEFQTPVQGTINANIDLEGTMTTPSISANIQTLNLQYNDFKNDSIVLDLNYLNRNMNLNFVISDNSAQILSARGTSDINLNLNEIGESFEDATINLSINSDSMDITSLSSLFGEVVKSEGILDIDLTASGKLKSPTVNGQIQLSDASLQTKTIRNDIGIPNALIVMSGQKATLQNLELKTSNGSGTFQGEFDISSLSYTLNGNMDNLLIKPPRISAALTGDVKVNGKGEQIDVKGKIEVEKLRVTLPDKPEKDLPEIQFVDEDKEEFVVASGDEESFFDKNVALDMNVHMKRNNWVRGQGANIELRGDMDIRKQFHDSLRIVGNISVIRGTYENFGKVFRIEDGNVSFSGGPEINPFLDITALYRVSNINVFINIGGRAQEPKITLSSDPAMSETDIVSYLVFGASSSDISSGERSAIGGVASGIAGGIAAQQLERLMGNAVSLDVVSISGTNVEVGKYLTEDLYIAFERGTTDSIIDSNNITYNKVLVEYHLFNNVTLDADVGGENPGADLFYNFNF